MKIVALSDTHGHHHKIELPASDTLIFGGDFCTEHTADFLGFNEYLGGLPFKNKLVVAGNHDHLFRTFPASIGKRMLANALYLENELIELNGIRFFGTPWHSVSGMPFFENPEILNKMWAPAYENRVDILITHFPPFGILDKAYWGEHLGCKEILHLVEKIHPKCHFFGHVHSHRGSLEHNGTHFFNTAVVDQFGYAAYPPVAVDWQP